MGKKAFDTLSETMFYVLIAFDKSDMCGTEIAEFIKSLTKGRVRIGPGTLYTILGSFQKEKLIEKKSQEGRKITYSITEKGRQIYIDEINRLEKCLRDSGRCK